MYWSSIDAVFKTHAQRLRFKLFVARFIRTALMMKPELMEPGDAFLM